MLNKSSLDMPFSSISISSESFEFYERNQKNLINAHLHYSLDKFKELPLADRKYEKNREFDNLFFRSKSWLFLIGT